MERNLSSPEGLLVGEQQCVKVPIPISRAFRAHAFQHSLQSAVETLHKTVTLRLIRLRVQIDVKPAWPSLRLWTLEADWA